MKGICCKCGLKKDVLFYEQKGRETLNICHDCLADEKNPKIKTIKVINGKFDLPKKYQELFKKHKPITIRLPWCVQTQRLLKTDMPVNCSNQMWFRDKKRGDKPYVPIGFMEINKEKFRVVEERNGNKI